MRTYGDPQALVAFYVKHGCLDKACQLVVENDLGDAVRCPGRVARWPNGTSAS